MYDNSKKSYLPSPYENDFLKVENNFGKRVLKTINPTRHIENSKRPSIIKVIISNITVKVMNNGK